MNIIKSRAAYVSAFFLLFICGWVYADSSIPLGIIGGQGNAPYAALVAQDGAVTTLSGLPSSGLTFRVGMNASGEGIIGGTNGVDAYAALVSPQGVLTPVGGLLAPGEIYTAAINASGSGIVGGGHLATNVPFAALVAPGGAATVIGGLPVNGLIYGVAIDPTGAGIVGGIGPSSSAYAALVTSNGTLQPLTGLPSSGAIYWVATNASQERFIGGQGSTSVYAAFIKSDGAVDPVANLPLGTAYSVGVNASGSGIIGGTSLSLPYAALVSSQGAVNTLMGLPSTSGTIYNVAINDSGTGLISGFSASGPYGTFVAPNGTLTPLVGLPVGEGFLDGTALHSSGIGLVGGTTMGASFAALAAPNGTLTYLSGLSTQGQINSTAIALLDQLVPKSLGLFDSCMNTQLTMSDSLTQHCMIRRQRQLRWCDACCEQESFSIWGSVFGNYVYEKQRHVIPSYSNRIAGVLVGIEYNASEDIVLGGAVSYAFNDMQHGQHSGGADINQESGVFYASVYKEQFYMDVALWIGGFQSSYRRNSLLGITSRSRPSGWNISPHLEVGVPCCLDACLGIICDPFIAFDWVSNFQSSFCEKGSAGFNLALNRQCASMLRSQVGVRFCESLQYRWGELLLEQTVAYVNRAFFDGKRGTAAFIGAYSFFDVVTLDSSAQNLGMIQLHMECCPCDLRGIYGSVDYQGSYGSNFQSSMLTVGLGKNF